MIKQIDRVIGDLKKQVDEFHQGAGSLKPLTLGIVAVNHAAQYLSYEGDRTYPTNGRNHKHPVQEADEAERRLVQKVKPAYDELLLLSFEATNQPPYDFKWVNKQKTEREYGAILTRLSREYDARF